MSEEKIMQHGNPAQAPEGCVAIPKTLLQDLIDDVEEYAGSRAFKRAETAWRQDLIARARDVFDTAPAAYRAAPTNSWKTGTPPVPEGKCREFIIAVRRAQSKPAGKVFVFSASYANNFTDDGCLSDRDGDEFVANGWHLCGLDMSGEFNEVYEPVGLNEGDEIVGWQELPKWSAAPAAPSASSALEVHIRPIIMAGHPNARQVWIVNGGQQFAVGNPHETHEDAEWFAGQLHKALAPAAPAVAPVPDGSKFAAYPAARRALASSIEEVEAMSASEDRGLTIAECESMALVLHELRRLQAIEREAVEIVARAAATDTSAAPAQAEQQGDGGAKPVASSASDAASEPFVYMHPDQVQRAKGGGAAQVRKKPYSEGGLPLYSRPTNEHPPARVALTNAQILARARKYQCNGPEPALHFYTASLIDFAREIIAVSAAPIFTGEQRNDLIARLQKEWSRSGIARETKNILQESINALYTHPASDQPSARVQLSDGVRAALLNVLDLADREERHRTNQAWLNLRRAIDDARAILAASAAHEERTPEQG